MQIEHVFGDQRPFAQCHAPTLLAQRGGGLLVAWFGGSRESHSDTAIWIAERKPLASIGVRLNAPPGTAWDAPHLAARVETQDSSAPSGRRGSAPRPHWNPVLFSPEPGLVVLHFKVGGSIRRWETWAQLSRDGGRSWEAPAPLVPGDRGGRGAVKNKPIRLHSGAWLAGASRERWRRWDVFFDRSEDGLSDWQASPQVALDRGRYSTKGLIQPALWQSPDGRVHALCRSTFGCLFETHSDDEGRSWSAATPTSVPNNNSGIDLVPVPPAHGQRAAPPRLALACNPTHRRSARTPLSILFSHDGGESWPDRIEVETGPGEFSYPALIPYEGGLCVAYTWNRRRIAVAWIDESELPAAAPRTR